jgi:hypothetical protein
VASALISVGCASPAAPPVGSPIERLPRLASRVPDEADRAARDLSVALLRNDTAAAAREAETLEAIDAARASAGEPRTGLAAYARDAETALLPAGPARRAAQARVLERDDVPPELASRIAEDVADDPLALAAKRIREDRLARWGGSANVIAEGLGGSITTPVMVPVRLTQAVVRVALHLHDEEAMTPRQRQALRHWKDFVEQNPTAPEAAEVVEKIERAQLRWTELQVETALRRGEAALAADEPILAAFLAERALRYRAEDAEALALLDEATRAGREWNENRARTLTVANPVAPLQPEDWALARALLAPGSDLASAAGRVIADDEAAPSDAEVAEFALALAAREAGRESEEWERLRTIADSKSLMARHAQALVDHPALDPYGAFRVARAEKTKENARRVALGPLAYGARDHDLPWLIEWLVEVPTLTGVVFGLPSRMLAFPYGRSEKRAAAALARRYLERTPDGEHAAELREWLREYEEDRGNHYAALELAEDDARVSDEERAELREAAAEQVVAAADRERSRAGRMRLLALAAERFDGTEAAQDAKRRIRSELARATPQRIRIRKQYLTENTEIAGPRALALRPELLDEQLANGELHEEGVALVGGRWLELSYVGKNGAKGAPERRQHELGDEHLARVVAMLEESAIRRTRVDRDATYDPDAQRETFFERARLGLADDDLRRGGDSEYTFEGMRERYGIVRGRESILPVELVLQTGLEDYGFGAFPRIRMPRETPDQILYR